MGTQNTTQNKSATKIGVSGLTLLANIIITITSDPVSNEMKVLFIATALPILMNIILETAITLYAPFPKHDTEKIQEKSNLLFLAGILLTTAIITATKIDIYTASALLVATVLSLAYIMHTCETKPQQHQPPTETEEQQA